MMEMSNVLVSCNTLSNKDKSIIIRMLAPFSPHLCEELWSQIDSNGFVFDSQWPKTDSSLIADDNVKIGVQVNGKVRGTVCFSNKTDKNEALKIAKSNTNVSKFIKNSEILKEIYIPGKIINFVIKN